MQTIQEELQTIQKTKLYMSLTLRQAARLYQKQGNDIGHRVLIHCANQLLLFNPLDIYNYSHGETTRRVDSLLLK